MDHYQCLGVGRSASPNQIESAARLALLRHGADAELTERIMDAWYVVGDPDRRFDYDFWLLTHPSPAGAYAPAEHGAAPQRIPEPDVPRVPGPRSASGPLPPVATRRSPPVGLSPAVASGESSPQLDTAQSTWREAGPGPGERGGPGINLQRLLVLCGLMAATLGLVTVLVTLTSSSGNLLVNGLCWLGLLLIGRLWPRAGIHGGHSRNR